MDQDSVSVGNIKESPFTYKGPTMEELKIAKASEFLKELKLTSCKLSYDHPDVQRSEAKVV